MPGFHHSIAILPLPFRRCKIPLFCKSYARKFCTVTAIKSKKIRNGNGKMSTEEWQQNGGNQALHCKSTDMGLVYRTVCLFTVQLLLVHCTYKWRDGYAELSWVTGYTLRWFTRPQMVTHPSTNWAQRRVTSLIMTNVLTTTPRRHTA